MFGGLTAGTDVLSVLSFFLKPSFFAFCASKINNPAGVLCQGKGQPLASECALFFVFFIVELEEVVTLQQSFLSLKNKNPILLLLLIRFSTFFWLSRNKLTFRVLIGKPTQRIYSPCLFYFGKKSSKKKKKAEKRKSSGGGSIN